MHRNDLAEILSRESSHYSAKELEDKLSSAKVPFGKVKSLDEVIEGPTAQGMIVEELINNQATRRLKHIAFNRFWED